MKIGESNNFNNDIKENHDQINSSFLKLATICQSYRDFLNEKKLTPNSSDKLSTSTDTGRDFC